MTDYIEHISNPDDLITSYSETRAGFISIALEKNKRATPYIEEARVLNDRIKNLKSSDELLGLTDIRRGLIAASGVSEKAIKHLGEEGCVDSIREFIKNFLKPSGDNFKEELIFRFLLNRGDSFGGSMRNIVGAIAQKKLSLSITSSLNLAYIEFYWLSNNVGRWISSKKSGVEIEMDGLKGLSWKTQKNEYRTLLFNIKVPFIGNNIDIILLKTFYNQNLQEAIKKPENYIALGELKGGIDPAGADEHWKTAKTAIDRIKTSFAKEDYNPYVFFIGAAIESKMATEIYENLKSGYINNAGNLTKPEHIISVVKWLLYI